MNKELTERQQIILNFISEFIEENGFPPTYREIGAFFNISSTFGVKRHIDALIKKGYLQSGNNLSRSLSLVNNNKSEKNNNFASIPLVGRVAAGFPILAEQNIEDNISIDSKLIRNNNNCFALKVRGDSMINAGIFENDIVIISQQNTALNGDIVVGLLGDEATLKRFVKIGNRNCLMPENDNYPLIEIQNREDFSIIGKVIAVFRFYN